MLRLFPLVLVPLHELTVERVSLTKLDLRYTPGKITYFVDFVVFEVKRNKYNLCSKQTSEKGTSSNVNAPVLFIS